MKYCVNQAQFSQLSDKCSVVEINGFLKERCPDTRLGLPNFKCPFSEENYFVIYSNFNYGLLSQPFINATCSDDPFGYQVIYKYLKVNVFGDAFFINANVAPEYDGKGCW